MRLICPHCMSGVVVPDDVAGKEATCPSCGKSFPTPTRYSAAVVPEAPPPVPPPAPPATSAEGSTLVLPPPAPPPGLVPAPPSTPNGFLPPAPRGAAEVPAPAGYTKAVGFTLAPHAVAWLPAMLLTAVLVLTFFTWVGCYAGASAVYSQRPWGAMFGLTPFRDYKYEEANPPIPGGWLDKVSGYHDWKIFVPCFLALFVALVFAWAERGIRTYEPRSVAWLAKLWPWRNGIVAGGAVLVLVLLLVQWMKGFPMERAIREQISEKFADRREKAGNSPAEQDRLQYQEDQEFDKYNLEHTTWMYLALLCSALAVLAILLRIALDARGNKAPPKLVLHY
jgi:hypothetical protein